MHGSRGSRRGSGRRRADAETSVTKRSASTAAAKPRSTSLASSLAQTVDQRGLGATARQYGKLEELLTTDSAYLLALAKCVDLSDSQAFASAAINLALPYDIMLPLLRGVLERDFIMHRASPTTILRGNNVATRMMTTFARKVGQEYVQTVLKPVLGPLVADDVGSLELDPIKLRKLAPKELLAETERRSKLVSRHVHAIVSAITSKSAIAAMPADLRVVCKYLEELTIQHLSAHSVSQILGGFLILRLFNPALVGPEVYGVVPGSTIITGQVRRNLVIIGKVLQAVSNGIKFTANKETFMQTLNPCVDTEMPRMQAYFSDVLDPAPGTAASAAAGKERRVRKSTLTMPPMNPASYSDLTKLHQLLDVNSEAVLKELRESSMTRREKANVARDVEFVALLGELQQTHESRLALAMRVSGSWFPSRLIGGSSGSRSSTRRSAAGSSPNSSRGSRISRNSHSSRSSSRASKQVDKLDGLLVSNYEYYMANKDKIDTSVCEDAKFFYESGKTRTGVPVFYLILHRVTKEVLQDINQVAIHIFKTLGDAISERYVIVADMSWLESRQSLRPLMFRRVNSLARMFTHAQRKSVFAFYIVHPSPMSRTLLRFAMAFASRKVTRKVHEIYNWRDLDDVIALDTIALPDASKNFISKAFRVIKVNDKGKHQERLMKLTQHSILNIDPSNNSIKNEKMVLRLDQVQTWPTRPRELVIKFTPLSEQEAAAAAAARSFSIRHLFSSPRDKLTRQYLFHSQAERDEAINDLFRTHYLAMHLRYAQEYKVKLGSRGTFGRQYTWKLTQDSVLAISGSVIKYEISYRTIESVVVDHDDQCVLLMKLKHENRSQRVVCVTAVQLLEALNEARMALQMQALDQEMYDLEALVSQASS